MKVTRLKRNLAVGHFSVILSLGQPLGMHGVGNRTTEKRGLWCGAWKRPAMSEGNIQVSQCSGRVDYICL